MVILSVPYRTRKQTVGWVRVVINHGKVTCRLKTVLKRVESLVPLIGWPGYLPETDWMHADECQLCLGARIVKKTPSGAKLSPDESGIIVYGMPEPRPQMLPNGNLLVPFRAEGPGGIVGDGVREIGSDDPEYARWMEWRMRDLEALQTAQRSRLQKAR